MIAYFWTYINFNSAFNLFLFLRGNNLEDSNISDKLVTKGKTALSNLLMLPILFMLRTWNLYYTRVHSLHLYVYFIFKSRPVLLNFALFSFSWYVYNTRFSDKLIHTHAFSPFQLRDSWLIIQVVSAWKELWSREPKFHSTTETFSLINNLVENQILWGGRCLRIEVWLYLLVFINFLCIIFLG